MERFNRAVRRHHRARLKKARSKYWGTVWEHPELTDKDRAKYLGKLVTTPSPCSCWMCNRPRKRFGDSIADKKRKIFDQDSEL